jgi:hypothetical protein
MGFFRRQEEQVVVRILRGRYAAQGLAEPADPDLHRKASEIVDEAHGILRRRGGNLVDIVKALVADWVKKP